VLALGMISAKSAMRELSVAAC